LRQHVRCYLKSLPDPVSISVEILVGSDYRRARGRVTFIGRVRVRNRRTHELPNLVAVRYLPHLVAEQNYVSIRATVARVSEAIAVAVAAPGTHAVPCAAGVPRIPRTPAIVVACNGLAIDIVGVSLNIKRTSLDDPIFGLRTGRELMLSAAQVASIAEAVTVLVALPGVAQARTVIAGIADAVVFPVNAVTATSDAA